MLQDWFFIFLAQLYKSFIILLMGLKFLFQTLHMNVLFKIFQLILFGSILTIFSFLLFLLLLLFILNFLFFIFKFLKMNGLDKSMIIWSAPYSVFSLRHNLHFLIILVSFSNWRFRFLYVPICDGLAFNHLHWELF